MESNGSVSNFDFNCEVTNNYFKSSFARSMAFSNTNQSKSLDYVYFDRGTINEECETDQKVVTDDSAVGVTGNKGYSPFSRRSFGATVNNQFYNSDFGKINKGLNKTNDALKLWNMKKESLKREEVKGNNQTEDVGEELLRLRKECQNLLEENRRLQLERRPSPPQSPSMDLTFLQSQVETLQWQLKQAESSRQMYRAVLEQVSRFLERVHKNLDQVNGAKTCNSKGKSRVPRSRSVHTVATPTSHSRPSSPSPSPNYVHRASSVALMQESNSYATLRDTWRVPRAVVEEVPVEKLSQEAFRMLRTVQSLLGTREPDLAHRLTPTPTPVISSASETLNDSGSERRDSTSVGSCSSLLQSSCGGIRKSIDASSINSCSSRATTQCTGDENEVKPSSMTPQLTEDESGFSSMSSFHEVGLPECRTYPEVGLPIVDHNHRRWSSTPVDSQYHSTGTFCTPGETIRVLWV
ncbi:uncharacterized protein LOC142329158 isoform X2 [Lycorma delicatula]|uniref:uncharacterized protein LOC142329158 isoform X2 n=1 Tax=Lycorma delicatula TaxID=130591 RepID=UPI003F512E8D